MDVKIRDIIDALTSPVEPISPTVDGLEPGDPERKINGVAVTFLATQEIIEKASKLGADLIISHEGIYYSHWDKRAMLADDPVYADKLKVLSESGIAVFRFHDYIHHYHPDTVTHGLLEVLGWAGCEVDCRQAVSLLEIPGMTLREVIAHIKGRLGLPFIRYIGDPGKPCRRVAVFVGYRGSGESAIPVIKNDAPDLVIYGEGPEWETPEYVRDAVWQRKNLALLVLGHAESEAPGMEYFAGLLRQKFPGLAVHYIPHTPVFRLG